jgi:SAM-dependent methyltransferase
MKRALNVGGNSKEIELPSAYDGFAHLLLDINPKGNPDIVCDARQLATLDPDQFDAVYCSHNLEHYYLHDVPKVLRGILHVLRTGCCALIRVPDVHEVMRIAVERGLDMHDVLYQSSAGPITVCDVLYGYGVEIEHSGNDFYAHKTGFSQKSLLRALLDAGYTKVYSAVGNLEVVAYAFKGRPDPDMCARFGLPAK